MDLNAFKMCKGLRALGYAVLVLVAAIVALSYYAVVVLTWGPRLLRHASPLSLLVLTLFHLLLVMVGWCYVRVVVTDPGGVPGRWRPEGEEAVSLEDGSNPEGRLRAEGEEVVGLQQDGLSSEGRPSPGFRYCRRCNNWKPPRSHHCSVCQRCVLKMDHHCVWVVNCVGARNYKFFLLFLVYAFLETMLDTLALLPTFVQFFKKARDRSSSSGSLAVTFLAFVLNLAFVLSLLCFIMMHASLVLNNTTSIEVHEKKGAVRWRYDLGRKKNVEQVLGSKKALWCIPMFSKEDLEHTPALHGLDFPTQSDVDVQHL